MIILVEHGNTNLAVYEAQILPPAGHILTIEDSKYQVLGSRSTINLNNRRSGRDQETNITITVIPYTKS